jgi:hypothetical protein
MRGHAPRNGVRAGLSRDNTTLERSGRALALCGARDDATKLSDELALRFPAATLTERIQRPVIAAALAIQGGDPARGLALLEPVAPYDHARSADFWPPISGALRISLLGAAPKPAGSSRRS